MIFGSGAHHGGAADIDVLDRQIPAHIRASDGFAEGIQVHHHHIDGGDALGLEISLVGGLGALGQDAAVDAGMECFHSAAQDFRGAGVFGHLGHGQPGCRQRRGRATTGDQLVAGGQQSFSQGHQAVLVRHAEQGRGRHGC